MRPDRAEDIRAAKPGASAENGGWDRERSEGFTLIDLLILVLAAAVLVLVGFLVLTR